MLTRLSAPLAAELLAAVRSALGRAALLSGLAVVFLPSAALRGGLLAATPLAALHPASGLPVLPSALLSGLGVPLRSATTMAARILLVVSSAALVLARLATRRLILPTALRSARITALHPTLLGPLLAPPTVHLAPLALLPALSTLVALLVLPLSR